MFHNRTLIIFLSLVIVGLSGIALRSFLISPVETVYAESRFESPDSENLSLIATLDNSQAGPQAIETFSVPATEPEIISVVNNDPQAMGWPNGLASTHTLMPWFVADLDATTSSEGSTWRTTVTISVVDALGNPITSATVYGLWNDKTAVGCTTDSSGRCSLTRTDMASNQVRTLTFTVNNLTHLESPLYTYLAMRNTDPDGDSDGTTITIIQPL